MVDSLQTKIRLDKVNAAIGILLPLLIGGCAAHEVTSEWRSPAIIADGSDAEWPGSPQFYDKRKKTTIRVMHDTESLFICFATNDRTIKMSLAEQGFSLWFDPEGRKNKVIGIHFPGRGRFGGFRAMNPEPGEPPPEPEIRMPATIEITFSETTGPLEMTVEEVRRTGIEIGVGQPDGSRYIYEFVVPFAVDEALSGVGSGKVIGVGITSGDGKPEKPMQKPSMGGDGGIGRGGMGRKPSMGGGFGGGGKPGFEKLPYPYEVWLKVHLI